MQEAKRESRWVWLMKTEEAPLVTDGVSTATGFDWSYHRSSLFFVLIIY